jgi:ADP-ribose pyrophosphatase YjhB (NUDIX family)
MNKDKFIEARSETMTAKGLIVQDNRFLMVKQQKHGRIFWNFPGGHIEEGESWDSKTLKVLELYKAFMNKRG